MVGMISAPGCSLEILPKVDPEGRPEDEHQVRRRLVRMLDIALGLDISLSSTADMARQNVTLLDILIRAFGDKLLAEVRSEEHTSELQSLMRISYAVFCLKKKT